MRSTFKFEAGGPMQVTFNVETEIIELETGMGQILRNAIPGRKTRTLEIKVTLLSDDDLKMIRYDEGPIPAVLQDRQPGFMMFFPDRKEFWLYGLSLDEFVKTAADLGLGIASGEVKAKRMVLLDES